MQKATNSKTKSQRFALNHIYFFRLKQFVLGQRKIQRRKRKFKNKFNRNKKQLKMIKRCVCSLFKITKYDLKVYMIKRTTLKIKFRHSATKIWVK